MGRAHGPQRRVQDFSFLSGRLYSQIPSPTFPTTNIATTSNASALDLEARRRYRRRNSEYPIPLAVTQSALVVIEG